MLLKGFLIYILVRQAQTKFQLAQNKTDLFAQKHSLNESKPPAPPQKEIRSGYITMICFRELELEHNVADPKQDK